MMDKEAQNEIKSLKEHIDTESDAKLELSKKNAALKQRVEDARIGEKLALADATRYLYKITTLRRRMDELEKLIETITRSERKYQTRIDAAIKMAKTAQDQIKKAGPLDHTLHYQRIQDILSSTTDEPAKPHTGKDGKPIIHFNADEIGGKYHATTKPAKPDIDKLRRLAQETTGPTVFRDGDTPEPAKPEREERLRDPDIKNWYGGFQR